MSKTCIIGLFFCLLSPTLVQSQETDPIVISVTRTPQMAKNVPASITVLTAKDIQESPAVHLDDLLRSVPSLQLPLSNSVVSHPTSQTISMRGIGGKRVLVMLDGVPINDPFGGWINWTKIPLHSIERIEIVRGGGSSLFGTFAMGGVINIVLKKPDQPDVFFESSYGSKETQSHQLHAANKVGKYRFTINADYFDTEGYRVVHPDIEGSVFTNAHSNHANFGLGLGKEIRPNLDWTLRGHYFQENQNTGTPLNDNERTVYDFNSQLKFQSSAVGDVMATVFGQFQDFSTDNALPTGSDTEFLSDVHETPSRDLGGSLQWTKPISSFVSFVTAGVDYRHIYGEDKEKRLDFAGNVTLDRKAEGTQQIFGGFGEANLSPHAKLDILLSARVDKWKNQDGMQVDAPGGVTVFAERDETEVSPRASIRFQPGGPVALRGAAYRAFRAPTIDELYRSFVSFNTTSLSNPRLKAEILKGGEVGIDLIEENFDFQITGFFNEVSNTIASVLISGAPPTFEQQNIGETKSKGIESTIRVSPTKKIGVSLSHVYNDAKIESAPNNPAVSGNRVPDVSKNVVQMKLGVRAPKNITVQLQGRYLSNQFDDNENTLPLGAHFVLDVLLSKQFDESFSVFVRGENILDRRYLASRFGGSRIIGAPIHVFGGIRLQFG